MITRIFNFDNSYARLPDKFYQRVNPAKVESPRLINLNSELARDLGMADGIDEKTLADIFTGNVIPAGADPIAQVYAGHQFGNFVPQLGDGRAILLGEVIDTHGIRRDIQLKGAGRTKYSRGGDGLAPLGPVIREYVVSEAMHALGIPTTRALAMTTTGGMVFRDKRLPGGVITRVASSHIRLGTFEFFASRRDHEAVRTLADYAMDRHYPEARESENPYFAMYKMICERQAELVARWMGIGFIHGVMNTDNTAISGETIDYGPCAFMDTFHPDKVFSSIDTYGRYAFSNQPAIAQWNMAALAQCMFSLFADNSDQATKMAQSHLDTLPDLFRDKRREVFCAKLGLPADTAKYPEIAEDFLRLMRDAKADYTLAFRHLADALNEDGESEMLALFQNPETVSKWLCSWRKEVRNAGKPDTETISIMNQVNPAIIPRNHRVEEAIRAAEDNDDFTVMKRLTEALKHPFETPDIYQEYMKPPLPNEQVFQTFCGT